MRPPVKNIVVYVWRLCVLTVVIIVIFEGILRVFGFPKGLFNFAVPGTNGLYPENSTIEMLWGPIPYTIKTNSFGFRGNEIAPEKQAGTVRIAALGDSITDGFFVDNDDTYPVLLERILQKHGYSVEVINAARGAGSIGREYAILRDFLIPLQPDIALVTFVTNDISDLRVNANELLLRGPKQLRHNKELAASLWILTRTATGEFLADRYLSLRSKFYKSAKAKLGQKARYAIEGGNRYHENVRKYMERRLYTDGLVLFEPYSEEVHTLIEKYLMLLKKTNDLCQHHHITLIVIYFPSYAQVYARTFSLRMRDLLRAACHDAAIPFLDLTETFRKKGHDLILHLAPVDYHLNPTGNKVMADAIARFLMERNLLE